MDDNHPVNRLKSLVDELHEIFSGAEDKHLPMYDRAIEPTSIQAAANFVEQELVKVRNSDVHQATASPASESSPDDAVMEPAPDSTPSEPEPSNVPRPGDSTPLTDQPS